jgi:hypothetical protein
LANVVGLKDTSVLHRGSHKRPLHGVRLTTAMHWLPTALSPDRAQYSCMVPVLASAVLASLHNALGGGASALAAVAWGVVGAREPVVGAGKRTALGAAPRGAALVNVKEVHVLCWGGECGFNYKYTWTDTDGHRQTDADRHKHIHIDTDTETPTDTRQTHTNKHSCTHRQKGTDMQKADRDIPKKTDTGRHRQTEVERQSQVYIHYQV